MRRIVVPRRIAALSFLSFILSLGSMRLYAADPQPYAVALKPTGDATLDAAVKDSSELIRLRDKTAVGGFALVQRARDDATRFEQAARSFGYYNASVVITIGTRRSMIHHSSMRSTMLPRRRRFPLPSKSSTGRVSISDRSRSRAASRRTSNRPWA